MSDTIVGISVLQPVWIPGIYRLWFKGQKDSGSVSQGWIFIRDRATVGLPSKMPDYPEGCNEIWTFTRASHNVLDCAPSVNWISWEFHNAGSWTTAFVEMTHEERAFSKAGPEPTNTERGSWIHYNLNWTAPEERDRLMNELRLGGSIK